jgi:hypothetical protein
MFCEVGLFTKFCREIVARLLLSRATPTTLIPKFGRICRTLLFTVATVSAAMKTTFVVRPVTVENMLWI